MTAQPVRLRDIPARTLHQRLRAGRLWLNYGAATVQGQSALKQFSSALQQVYGAFPLAQSRPDFIDYHVQLRRPPGLRAWLRPQSAFLVDGMRPFAPFPLRNALPLFEWGVNWCFARRCNQHVLLHAGCLALGDRAVIMAAPPGAGKSTLSAAMMLRGFRLLSDEFGVLSMASGQMLPMLKPVALKNQSVGVIREFADAAVIGPLFTGTRKGDVAHLAPDETSVDAVQRSAVPALVLFPAWRAGGDTELKRLPAEQAFAYLAFNSFNYSSLGRPAFAAVGDVIAACPAYSLHYSNLDDAIAAVRRLLEEVAPRS